MVDEGHRRHSQKTGRRHYFRPSPLGKFFPRLLAWFIGNGRERGRGRVVKGKKEMGEVRRGREEMKN